jgi:hypothetical protein
MSSLHFNCESGVAGDMIVGSLLDLGADWDFLVSELGKLQLGDYSVSFRRVERCGVAATKFDVLVKEECMLRCMSDILDVIDGSRLSDRVKDLGKRIFLCLGEAEAAAHNTSLSEVHFHEVGAVDSIIDIVSAAILFTEIGAENVSCSTISLGCGRVKTAHGVFDVPAPAVRHLLKGAPTARTSISAELTTPTGAAIISTITTGFTDRMTEARKAGFGAGERDLQIPNVLEARIID